MKLLDRIVRFITSTTAETEADSERYGFMSYKSETHAVMYGVSLGFLFTTPIFWVKVFALLAVVCMECSRRVFDKRMMREIRDESQYFVPALVFGVWLAYGLYGLGAL